LLADDAWKIPGERAGIYYKYEKTIEPWFRD
jgi:hypothetical protein